MMWFTTTSGAHYVVDQEQKRFIRFNGPKRGLTHADRQWHEYADSNIFAVGSVAVFAYGDGTCRITTRIAEMGEE